MFRPSSLSHLISSARNVKGLPPQALVSSGIVALSPEAMLTHGLNVLDVLVVKLEASEVRSVAVRAWPIAVFDDCTLALDDLSVRALGLKKEQLISPTSLIVSPRTPKSKSKKKANRKRASRGPQQEERTGILFSPDGNLAPSTPDMVKRTGIHTITNGLANLQVTPAPLLSITRISIPLSPAKRVRVTSDADMELVRGDVFCAHLAELLLNRPLLAKMSISTTILGDDAYFEIVDMCRTTEEHAPGIPLCFTQDTAIEVISKQAENTKGVVSPALQPILGLDHVLDELKVLLNAAFHDTRDGNSDITESPSKPRGVIIYGPPGTGKTLLARNVAAAYSAHLQFISSSDVVGLPTDESLQFVERSFKVARRKRPSVIVLDELDVICPKRESLDAESSHRMVTALFLTLLDGADPSIMNGIFVIATTNKIDAIDPAMRRAGRFDREIELAPPDPKARALILRSIVHSPQTVGKVSMTAAQVDEIARVSHGYVGADLVVLWREAVRNFLERENGVSVTEEDFRFALRRVRPSALRDIAVELPSTRWEDIGGKELVKQRLQEAVEWPLQKQGSELFAKFGVSPPRGILLYGPPGCSKTLLARAVATECGANFISIKGAELLSKWVGESEKAVRNIFRRARQAAPCVIFFDEIDALAASRSSFGSGSAQGRIVAQLLTEVDGVESHGEDNSVTVIAATNRPDCLDEAFLRPGRIDVQMYVGLPDAAERFSIFQVHTRNTPLAKDVDLGFLSSDYQTLGYSGAEVAAVVREAAVCAMQRDVENVSEVTAQDFATALKLVRPRTPAHTITYFEEYERSRIS